MPGPCTLKRSLANLAKSDITQLTVLVKTRLRQMQYWLGLLSGFLAKTHLTLRPFSTFTIEKSLVSWRSGYLPRQPARFRVVS
jgi:hypothetical protein